MLCPTCAGTDFYAPLPQSMIGLHRGEHQHPEHDGNAVCPECLGSGRRLKKDGFCSHCGRLVNHWQECGACDGVGRVYTLFPNSAAVEPAPSVLHLD